MAYQDTTYFALLGMLATQGMSKDDVNAQAIGPVNVWKLFIAGQADAMAAVPDWTAQAQAAKMNIEIIPSDKYFKSMSQAIIDADDVIQKNPALIKKLVSASLHGREDITADPDAAAVAHVTAMQERPDRWSDGEKWGSTWR